MFAVLRDYEGVREGNMMGGRDDHSGLVLDGLVFDAGGRNTYFDKPTAALRYASEGDGAIASFSISQRHDPQLHVREYLWLRGLHPRAGRHL